MADKLKVKNQKNAGETEIMQFAGLSEAKPAVFFGGFVETLLFQTRENSKGIFLAKKPEKNQKVFLGQGKLFPIFLWNAVAFFSGRKGLYNGR